MNIPTKSNPTFVFDLKTARLLRPWSKKIVSTALAAAALLTSANVSSAAQLTWDAGNTNNGATIDAASGSWNLTESVTNYTATTSTISTNNVNLVAGGLDWFQVNVPANALAATNTLLYATNLPVNVWFSLTQTTNNVGDTLLMAGVTSGVSVLTTNLASAPTNIVPGGTYYIGIDNSANLDPVGYALQVDLSLTNAVVTLATNLNWNTGSGNTRWTQTSTTVGLNGAIFAGADAGAGTYQVALTGVQMSVTNLQVNANGYEFSGANLYLPSGTILSVADGKSVTFNNLVTGPNNAIDWRLGAGGAPASMTLLGNFTGGQFRAGSTNGSTLWLGGPGTSSGGVFTINANVIHTNGTWANTSTWQVGRPGASAQAQAGNASFPGVYTMDGAGAILNPTTALQISRGGGSGKVIIKNGTVNMAATSAGAVQVMSDGGGAGSFFMEGGTLNLGSSVGAGSIWLDKVGAPSNSVAIFSQSGGTIRAWGGLQSGAASGTFTNSTSAFTNSGGFLYIGNVGSIGISRGAVYAPTNSFVFSGGTVGALQSWISAVPLTLDTLNGNITFQCADEGASPFNISLSGALTGPGGLNKTGGGTLTLSGANNYAGSTVVSNGILKIVPLLSPTNGSLTLDGSAFSPSLTVAPASAGQFMTVNGNLTFAAGTVTVNFDFGALPPSPSVAPIQVTNNVACTVTPDVAIAGSAIAVGTYPLIKYVGSVSGTLPAAPTTLPAATTGYITNITATKTIALVVTTSPVSASMTWRVGSGGWGLSLPAQNWTLFGSPVVYTEPNAVQFDDTATGPFPVAVSNVSVVTPNSITVLGTNVWTISGNGGSIGGGAALTKAGSSTVTLSGTNTYSGGTLVSGGQLNINNGGTSAANSAIGTGPLTLALGAKVDNTSGQNVTLQPTIAQSWLDDWTFVGSTNFNAGAGAVTLGSSVVMLTVTGNKLEVGGAISDGGNTYKLQKAGGGTLTLGADSTFSGGLQLDSGLLEIKTANGLGNGVFTISGSATFDNLSGADMTVSGITGVTLPTVGTVTFLGTSNLSFGTVAAIQSGQGDKSLNVISNTLTFGGNFTSGNSIITKIGQGRLILAGSGVSQFVGTVNEGELTLAHDLNSAIGTGDSGNGVLVQSNAVVKLAGTLLNQIPDSVDTRLNEGGVFDMNGYSETIRSLFMTNGVLRNGAAGTASTLTTGTAETNWVFLTSANNVFDVPDAGSSLSIAGNVTGPGSLVKTGAGAVTVQGTNTYTGNTTVNQGSLTINHPFLDAASTVTVNTNGILTLNFAGSETNTVAVLVLNGVSKPNGVYNTTTDPLYLAGAGSLKVGAPSLVSTNADLISLVLSPAGTLSPTFGSNVLNYTATNAYVDSPTVTVVNADLTATNKLIFNGSTNALASGVPSGPLSLTLGVNNPVVVQVTAEDGLTVKTYTVNVTRQPSLTPVTLTNSVSGSTLTLSWPADHLGYSLQVQTNSRSLGLKTNWVALPGSESLTTTNLPIDKANPTVFYRLVYP